MIFAIHQSYAQSGVTSRNQAGDSSRASDDSDYVEIHPDLPPETYFALTYNAGTPLEGIPGWYDVAGGDGFAKDFKREFKVSFSDVEMSFPFAFALGRKEEQPPFPSPEFTVVQAEERDSRVGKSPTLPYKAFYLTNRVTNSTIVSVTDKLKSHQVSPAEGSTPAVIAYRWSLGTVSALEPVAITTSQLFKLPDSEAEEDSKFGLIVPFSDGGGYLSSVDPATKKPIFSPTLRAVYLHKPKQLKVKLSWEPPGALQVWHTPFKARTDNDTYYANGQIEQGHEFVYKDSDNPVFVEAVTPGKAKLKWGIGNRYHAIQIIPVDMAVDANRDGTISFAGEPPPSGSEGTDRTTKERPFRFWINDDQDSRDRPVTQGEDPGSTVIATDEGEVTPVQIQDSSDNEIKSKRDLEDFARLHVHIGGFYEKIANGIFKIGLRWRNFKGKTPKIKVYKSTATTGSDSYLKSETAAFDQISGDDAEMLGEVAGEGTLILDREDLWSHFSQTNPKLCLLFEGSGEGKGELCITIHDENGKAIGEGPKVWLDLKDVRKMYQRTYGKPRQGSVAWKKPDQYNPYQEPVVTNAPLENPEVPFEKPPDETSDTIVLVHGIHGLMILTESQAIAEYTQMASTAFKRLWWQGYKGRFGFYKWEAHHISQFNESEYRAWKSGRGLAAFLNQLPGENKNVWAFSQGGVVASSAIRDYQATPNVLLLMQAAIPAVCYVDNDLLNRYPNASPDTVSDLGYRGYHGATESRFINFADPSDLATGFGWRTAQNIKPEPSYVYDASEPSGDPQRHRIGGYYETIYSPDPNGFPVEIFHQFVRSVTDLHESLPMIARSKGKTIAHEPELEGIISVRLDSRFGFDNEHGAAFDRPIQKNLNDFYDEVLTQFEIPYNP